MVKTAATTGALDHFRRGEEKEEEENRGYQEKPKNSSRKELRENRDSEERDSHN